MQENSIGLMCVVRNEAERIREFLDHTLPFVDEVAIADQQSDDGTWEILQEYQKDSVVPFKIWQDEKHGISEPSKQPTADMLSTEWVLYLDPDELMDIKALEQLHTFTKRADVDGFLFIRKNIFIVRVLGDNTPLEPKVLEVLHPTLDYQLRLTRRSKSMFPPQLHVRVRVRSEDGNEYLEKTQLTMEHRKTLKEQFDDDSRYKEPMDKIKQQIKDGTVKNW
jgi:glycosyltransferase involved in cell wall biosynthesis